MKRISRGDRVHVKGSNDGNVFEVEHVLRLAKERKHMAVFKGTCHRIAISSLEKIGE